MVSAGPTVRDFSTAPGGGSTPERRLRERVDMAVFGAAPGFVRASIRLVPGRPPAGFAAVSAYLRGVAARTESANVAAGLLPWHEAYEAVGLLGTPTPPEILAAWAALPDGVPSQGPLLDLINAFSLAHLVPAAAYAVPEPALGVWLRPARGCETFEDLSGAVSQPPVGELILAEGEARAMALAWHGPSGRPFAPRGDAATLVHLDTLGPTADVDCAAGLGDAFLRLATAYLGMEGSCQVLHRGAPAATWEW